MYCIFYSTTNCISLFSMYARRVLHVNLSPGGPCTGHFVAFPSLPFLWSRSGCSRLAARWLLPFLIPSACPPPASRLVSSHSPDPKCDGNERGGVQMRGAGWGLRTLRNGRGDAFTNGVRRAEKRCDLRQRSIPPASRPGSRKGVIMRTALGSLWCLWQKRDFAGEVSALPANGGRGLPL